MTKYEITVAVLVDMKAAGYHECVIGYDAMSPACKWWEQELWEQEGPYSIWGWHDSWKEGTRGTEIKNCRNNGSWPAVWAIIEKHGVSGGAGNSHQHQLKRDTLISGTYDLRADNAIEMIQNEWVLEAI